MKIKIITILSMSLLLFSACENELEKNIAFDYTATSVGSTMSGDTIIIKKSTPISFNFSGNADIITFFSGKPGSEFSKRNLLLSPIEGTTSILKFQNMPQYGVIAGTLKVYLSTTFEGLLLNNKAKDSLAVSTHEWKEITTDCNLSTVSGTVKSASLPLNDYLGKRLTIAFRYKTEQNAAAQPTWEIQNLQIENTLASGTVSVLKAANMGFGSLDMISTSDPYKKIAGAGTWDLSAIANATLPKIRISSSPIAQPMNYDWVISNPIILNTRMPDSGTAIKAMANRLNSYLYQYDAVGTYTVSFIGIKANYLSNSEVVKEMIIKVIE